MTAEQRARFQRRSRTTRKPLPPRPVKPASVPASGYERKRAERCYLLALEEWEYQRELRPYNAAKKRLQRMREVLGTNPVKKFRKNKKL